MFRPLATCCTVMRAGLLYGHTGYDVTSYFRSAFTEVRKTAAKPRPTALGGILAARRFACPTNWRASCLTYFRQTAVAFTIDLSTCCLRRRIFHQNLHRYRPIVSSADAARTIEISTLLSKMGLWCVRVIGRRFHDLRMFFERGVDAVSTSLCLLHVFFELSYHIQLKHGQFTRAKNHSN